jgi:hypothetical protein
MRIVSALGVALAGLSRAHKSEADRHCAIGDKAVKDLHLGRTPAPRIAQDAAARLVAGLELDLRLKEAAVAISTAWSRGKTWNAFPVSEADRLRDAFVLA